VLAIVGIGLALRYQKLSDVITTAVVVAAALVYWLAYLQRRARRGELGRQADRHDRARH